MNESFMSRQKNICHNFCENKNNVMFFADTSVTNNLSKNMSNKKNLSVRYLKNDVLNKQKDKKMYKKYLR